MDDDPLVWMLSVNGLIVDMWTYGMRLARPRRRRGERG